MELMRGHCCWLLLCVACGEVNDNNHLGDAPLNPDGNTDDAIIDAPPAAPGTIRWARSLSALSGLGVTDGPGGITVTGYYAAPTDFGGGAMVSAGQVDMAYGGFNSDTGAYIYQNHFGDTGQEYAWTRGVEGTGQAIIYGVSYGAMQNVGTGQVAGGGGTGSDGFIGKYGTTGAPGWLARMVGPGEDKFVGTAPGPNSTVYGLGWFETSTSFNNGTLSGTGREIMLARFNSFTGAVDLTKTYGGTGRDEGASAASYGGTLVTCGFFDDTINFGGTSQPVTAVGGLDTWVAKLDGNGNGVWAARFGGTGDDRDPEIAMDAAGDVYIAGEFNAPIAFGAVNLTPVGMSDMFIAKLRGTDGQVVWATSIGSPGSDPVGAIAVDNMGHVAVVGTAGGLIAGEQTNGGLDSIIAEFDATNGAKRFIKVISTPADERGGAITYGANHEIYAVVGIAGAFDFGVTLEGAANPTAVLLRIAP